MEAALTKAMRLFAEFHEVRTCRLSGWQDAFHTAWKYLYRYPRNEICELAKRWHDDGARALKPTEREFLEEVYEYRLMDVGLYRTFLMPIKPMPNDPYADVTSKEVIRAWATSCDRWEKTLHGVNYVIRADETALVCGFLPLMFRDKDGKCIESICLRTRWTAYAFPQTRRMRYSLKNHARMRRYWVVSHIVFIRRVVDLYVSPDAQSIVMEYIGDDMAYGQLRRMIVAREEYTPLEPTPELARAMAWCWKRFDHSLRGEDLIDDAERVVQAWLVTQGSPQRKKRKRGV